MDAEIQSLKQQIGNFRANLESVRIRKSSIADPRDMTDDLRIQEEYLTDELSKLETKLRRLEKQHAEKLKNSRTLWGNVLSIFRDSAWGGITAAITVIVAVWSFYNFLLPNINALSQTPTPTATLQAATNTPFASTQGSQTTVPTQTVTETPTLTAISTETITPTASPTNTLTPSSEPMQTPTLVLTNTVSPTATIFPSDVPASEACIGTVVQVGIENQIMIYTDATATRTLPQTIPTDNFERVRIIDKSEGTNIRYKIEYQPVTSERVFIGWVDGRQIELDASKNCQKLIGK